MDESSRKYIQIPILDGKAKKYSGGDIRKKKEFKKRFNILELIPYKR